MSESSSSQLFRTTTGIQSGPEVSDESRFGMTFVTFFGSYRNIMQFQSSSRKKNR